MQGEACVAGAVRPVRLASAPLFRSAHQALLFAMTYSATQHGTAAAAERQIALQARERYLPEPGSGRGLRGLDGAAQAGMIRSKVERMAPLNVAVLVARFAILSTADRQAACALLALRARTAMPRGLELQVITLLVRRHFGLRVNLPGVADDQDVDERTVRRWALSARKWIMPIERLAMHQIEVELEQAGIVECAS